MIGLGKTAMASARSFLGLSGGLSAAAEATVLGAGGAYKAAHAVGQGMGFAWKNPGAAGLMFGGATGAIGGLFDPNSSMIGGAIGGAAKWGAAGAAFGRYGKPGIQAGRSLQGPYSAMHRAQVGGAMSVSQFTGDMRALFGAGQSKYNAVKANTARADASIGTSAVKNEPVQKIISNVSKPGRMTRAERRAQKVRMQHESNMRTMGPRERGVYRRQNLGAEAIASEIDAIVAGGMTGSMPGAARTGYRQRTNYQTGMTQAEMAARQADPANITRRAGGGVSGSATAAAARQHTRGVQGAVQDAGFRSAARRFGPI